MKTVRLLLQRNEKKKMDRWIGKVAVVTGASSGIGACICSALVAEGLQVVGLARRSEKINELAKNEEGKRGKLYAVKCDVTNKDDVTKAFQWILENLGPVHVLVNNAGLYKCGSILEGNPDDWKTVLDTNVFGLTLCSQHAMKQMKDHRIAGHIIHMNSVVGHSPIAGDPPILNMYSPSKYSVTALSNIMKQEIDYFQLKIKITSISPGITDTYLFENSGTKLDMNKLPHLKPKDVTDAVVYVLGTGPNVQIQELTIVPFGENLQKEIKN